MRQYSLFAVSPASTITIGDLLNWNTAYGWGDHSAAGYLTSFIETDPIFAASPAGTITVPDIVNWNTAYGWGNHALAGYLTAETDPVWVAAEPSYGNLGQAEVLLGNWDNTANPWADNEVAALTGGAQGDILFHNGTSWTKLSASTSGYVLTTNGAGANPSWTSVAAASGGLYAEMFMDNNATATNTVTQNVYVALAGYGAGSLNGWTYGSDSLTAGAGAAGNYHVDYSVSAVPSAANKNFEFTVTINDVVQTNCNSEREYTSSANIGSSGSSCILAGIVPGDVIKLKARQTTAVPIATLTVVDSNLSLSQL